MHVKKGDKVVITSGKDVHETGEIIAIDRTKGRVKVERRNMVVKHRQPNPLTGEDGARIDQENWLDSSNVSLYSDSLEGPVRTQKRWVGADKELFDSKAKAFASFGDDVPTRIRKVRFSTKTEEVFDDLSVE